MTDLELLELAAKAAGVDYDADQSKPHPKSGSFWGLWLVINHEPHEGQRRYWNPLRDDGDALRLAVKLKLDVSFGNRYYFDEGPMTFCGTYWSSGESATFHRFVKHESDAMSATRRAIVRAAAEIGKAMK